MSYSTADYVIQGAFLILTVIFPWFMCGQRFRSFIFRFFLAFIIPFLVVTAWGFWRVIYFDSAMHNDIPGIGYIVVASICGIVSSILFLIRWFFLNTRTIKFNKP